MKDRIRLLPESIANQIAAGEVVNRPSSVVKEVMENAIDAGADTITVNIRDGGKGLIQIVDNGCGMSEIDARMAFDRHATSKITSVDDIYKLQTFGFRGEALASIASVAEVELRTRQHDVELGTRVAIHGGRFVSQEAVNCPPGTQLLIKNLFYNVPARRRFLEKSTTETRHIVAEFQRVALCHPDKSFSLYDSDVQVAKLSPANLKQRIVDVAGRGMAGNLLEVSAETTIVNIHGYVGRPEAARKSGREQFLFVNGRFFKSPYFTKAVISAYDKLIPAGTQPSYFIYLTVDPERIDVNVHPQKTEVKFADGTDMWQIINAAVRESLAKSGAVPAMDFEMDTSIEIPVHRSGITYREPGIAANPDFNPFERYGDEPADGGKASDNHASGFSEGLYGRAADKAASSAHDEYGEGAYPGVSGEEDYDISVMEFIEGEEASQPELGLGSVSCTEALRVGTRYLITAAAGGGIRVVDAVRVAEALLYADYLAMSEHGVCAAQQLLFLETVPLPPGEVAALVGSADELGSLGFVFTANDAGITLTAIPSGIEPGEACEVLSELASGALDGEQDAGSARRRMVAARLARAAARRTCRSMQPEEAAELLRRWEASGAGYTPSGLKTAVTLDESRIKRFFE